MGPGCSHLGEAGQRAVGICSSRVARWPPIIEALRAPSADKSLHASGVKEPPGPCLGLGGRGGTVLAGRAGRGGGAPVTLRRLGL